MPVLPSSLSPHICIVSSPDLTQLLTESSLPPLHHILQSFSPFPQVNTRTTTLTTVSHASFALRFSDLSETEMACKEDEEQRAARTIDWIGARISHRCAKWIEDIEKTGDKQIPKTPWWDELKRCTEGDHVPSRSETWNHPVAVIMAVSTNAPNPLQAITALHARPFEFPSWVDPTFLRYTVIIHPENSSLSDEEAGALYNAVKKQFGLHSYLLPLSLPHPPPKPVPVPALMPRLPPPPSEDSPSDYQHAVLPTPTPTTVTFESQISMNLVNTLRMCDKDIQSTARFTREFLVMSLIPWMEKCVVEWNENFTSTRRLPSRLFSSTRRLFGSPSPSPGPTSRPVSAVSSLPSTRSGTPGTANGPAALSTPPPPQQRRLAEFATVLGDFKLAVTVWEALRKEGKGGSEILPLLLSPSPTVQSHVSNALSIIFSQGLSSRAQTQALLCAVRWEIGIGYPDFIDNILEGERWLVWAAGETEESPSAILLAHAAFLSAKKQATRRAALLYYSAANRLEKCGIRPLTMYFLRRAHEMYKARPTKELSPSFWESEGKSPSDRDGFDAIISGIEHPLGRLLYTTGDVASAVRFFIGLLRGTPPVTPAFSPPSSANGGINEDQMPQSIDKVVLEDFRVSLAHFKSTSGSKEGTLDFKLPFTFCQQKQTRLRLPRDISNSKSFQWDKLEEDWTRFWKSLGGKEELAKSGKACVDENFWVDVVLRNPLEVEVNISNLTVFVREAGADGASPCESFVDVEVVDTVLLGAKETRILPISVRSSKPVSLIITHVAYDFLSLLPSTEPLSHRGRRLNDTVAQRHTPTYAPDVVLKVDIAEASNKLLINFTDERHLVLAQGETKSLDLRFINAGTRPVRELWMITNPDDQVWINDKEYPDADDWHETMESANSVAPRKPYKVSFPGGDISTLIPGESVDISIFLHNEQAGDKELCLLFVYREHDTAVFNPVQVIRYYEVQPILKIVTDSQPSAEPDFLFRLNLHVENVFTSALRVNQITTISPTWKAHPIATEDLDANILPQQSARFTLGSSLWSQSSQSHSVEFLRSKLRQVLMGVPVEASSPPRTTLSCSHISKKSHRRFESERVMRHFIHAGKRTWTNDRVLKAHPYIPDQSFAHIFPLYHPHCVDVVIFWEIAGQHRSGYLLVSGLFMGASHSPLREIIEEAENRKVNRSMYAETRREKVEMIQAIRDSDWNAEIDPITVTTAFEDKIAHCFSRGPCLTSINFILRNHSLTHRVRYLLILTTEESLTTPRYTGRTTFRGLLEASELATVRSTVCIIRPGSYTVTGWQLVIEVLETDGQIRERYAQQSENQENPIILVCDAQ